MEQFSRCWWQKVNEIDVIDAGSSNNGLEYRADVFVLAAGFPVGC